MRKNKLVSLLSTLNTREWQRLHDYVSSPYFNKRRELIPLLEYFSDRLQREEAPTFNKKTIFAVIFPDEPFDDQQLAYQFNYLLQLTEDFLAWEALEEDPMVLQRSKLIALLERRQEKHFKLHFKKARKLVGQSPERSDIFWRNHYYLAEISAQAFMNKRKRQYDQSFQELSDSLDYYYMYEKLRYSCAMVNIEGIAASKYDIKMIEAIIQQLDREETVDFHLQIYRLIYQSLTEPESEGTFDRLKKLIQKHQADLSKSEQREILLFAINICARQIRQGREEFYEEALSLYLLGIDNKALFAGSNLTHWTFNNVVKLALRLKRHDWLEAFIKEYAQHLAPNVREDTMNYSLAELAFNQGNYDAVLQRINQIKFTDPQYYLGSRIMLLKAFFELGAIDSMASQLASFIMFLRRNKKISSDYKKTLLNFCSLLHLILRSQPDKKEKVLSKIEETRQKIEGPWLLQVADRMLR